ncbi:type II toxin-antitoxin system VapC family toxin [Neisseria weixii]|uniref:type II toxin-antitoxin system VapC family toxin n=1 Tax=Neisseria weixii TaxID=1853276 RepID=UPI0035A0B0AB
MKYLLDTNMVIAISKKQPNIIHQIRQHRPSDFALSSIVYFELAFGAHNSQKVRENMQILEQLPFEILPFNQNDALQAGKIRADLKQKGTSIGVYDVLIAGQAIAQELVLITHNVKEFERVEGLRFEDWLGLVK